MQENERTEFKRQFVDDINKTIVAFANTTGGTIYIGIEDDGTVLGVENVDQVLLALTNSIKGTIGPDITMFVKATPINIEGKPIVKVDIERGTSRPYYLVKKGLRPLGVYIRLGSASIPASDNAILKMIKESSGDDYESASSINQSLKFDYCKEVFDKENIKLTKNKMLSLGMINENGLYTNLGLLLSDQCPYIIKIAVFNGKTRSELIDRNEFQGSLFEQLENVSKYIGMYNKTSSTFKGLYRIDEDEYPSLIIREALLNAIIHRDYSISGSTNISIFADRIEFISLGGLVKDIDYDDILIGTSKSRNPNLANVFYRLKLVEAFGTGIPRIFEAYKNYMQPIIQTTSNAFKITLFNMKNTPYDSNIVTLNEGNNSDEDKVIVHLYINKTITRDEVESLLGVSTSTALRILEGLLEKNEIVKLYSGKRTRYVLNLANK